jgi:hypothetical protein
MLRQSLSPAARRPLFATLERGLQSVNRHPRLWLGLFALLLIAQIRPWWIPQPDSRSYLSMARSLAVEGRMLNLGREHLWYFPGYSLLLSPVYFCSERPYWLISAFQWSAVVLLMLGVYQWAKSIVPEWAVWVAALSGVNAGVWFHAVRVLSEVPFMCTLIWSANAGLAAYRSRTPGHRVMFTVAAAVLLAITALIRPAGLMLAVGFGLSLGWQAIKHRVSWTRAVVLTLALGVPAAVGVVGFMRMEQATATQESARTYLSNFGDSARSPLASYIEGVRLAIRDSGRVVIPGMFKAYQEAGWYDSNLLVYFPVCLALVWGWWRLARQTVDPLLLGVPFYVLLHVVYPYEAGARFYVPLFPIFIASLACVLKGVDTRRLFAVTTFCACHMLIAVIYWLAFDEPRACAEARRFDEIAILSQQIAMPTAQVGATGLSENELLMLELELDHPIKARKRGVESGDTWLISGRKFQPGRPYQLSATTASFVLSRRDVGASEHRAPLAQ